jgi:hypothetical protein
MRGLTPEERTFLSSGTERYGTDHEWNVLAPKLVRLGRIVVLDDGRGFRTNLGTLALRVCPVGEAVSP